LRNDYKILKKNKKQRLYKAKLLRNKIGIKTGKNEETQLDKILHRFLQEGTECISKCPIFYAHDLIVKLENELVSMKCNLKEQVMNLLSGRI